MKKYPVQLFRWSLSLIGLIVLVAVMIFALSFRPQVSSQGNGIESLHKRLVQLGIPVNPAITSIPQETFVPIISPTAINPKSTALPTPTVIPAAYPPPPTSPPYPEWTLINKAEVSLLGVGSDLCSFFLARLFDNQNRAI